jgi:hypothetical protein
MYKLSASLLAALLTSMAVAQENAPAAPVVISRQAIDLKGQEMRKIVRDAAASQSAVVAPEKESDALRLKVLPPPVAVKNEAETPRLPAFPPPSTGFLDTLIDTLLDLDSNYAQDEADMLACKLRADPVPGARPVKTCPISSTAQSR